MAYGIIKQHESKQCIHAVSTTILKKLQVAFLLTLSFSFSGFSQNLYERPTIEHIPDYFFEGAFTAPLMLDSIIKDYDESAPINSGIYRTYCQLTKTIVGLKIDAKEIDDNIERIEKYMGRDNTIYGLALIPKANDSNEDSLEILLKAASIIGESSGEDSWEYAFAMYMISTLALNTDASNCLKYAKKSLTILEHEHQNNWLYHMALANKGMARILSNDSDGINDLTDSYNSLSKSLDDNNLDKHCFHLIFVTTNLATLYTVSGHHNEAISLITDFDEALYDMGLKSSELYMSVSKTLCYAYAMKKDRKNAKRYYEQAEQACIERFGKGSTEHTSLQQYRSLF